MCGGSPALPAVAPAPPPAQLATTPTPAAIRSSTAAESAQQFGSTLLTGGTGAPIAADTLGKKTLLGA